MALKVASAIRLEEAYFCLNCELVTNCLDICPACGHRELWSLEKWLGRVDSLEDSMDKEGHSSRESTSPRNLNIANGSNDLPRLLKQIGIVLNSFGWKGI